MNLDFKELKNLIFTYKDQLNLKENSFTLLGDEKYTYKMWEIKSDVERNIYNIIFDKYSKLLTYKTLNEDSNLFLIKNKSFENSIDNSLLDELISLYAEFLKYIIFTLKYFDNMMELSRFNSGESPKYYTEERINDNQKSFEVMQNFLDIENNQFLWGL